MLPFGQSSDSVALFGTCDRLQFYFCFWYLHESDGTQRLLSKQSIIQRLEGHIEAYFCSLGCSYLSFHEYFFHLSASLTRCPVFRGLSATSCIFARNIAADS